MTLLDTQMQAFIAQTMQHYPADAVVSNTAQQRQCYKNMYLAFALPRPANVKSVDKYVEGPDGHLIPVRHYDPQAKSSPENLKHPVQVVYLHGGGFVVGDLDSHDDLCAQMADLCGFKLVSVAYRLAPEHRYPCDITDCLAVVDHLLEQGKAVILVGDSAGATLAACVANARSSYTGTQLLGQVLIYPALANDANTPSMQEHAHAPLLSKQDMIFYHGIRVGEGHAPIQDPLCCPLHASSFADLPPSHLFPAQIDPLFDDCGLYAKALSRAGVEVENHTQAGDGLLHGHLRARHMSDKAGANFQLICKTILALGR
ncbi:alpha/beta hydrolase [Oceanospirillaceae bacterium]|nr:alpha/beta hydrolase [Oceanospirillaceae bacterium]MDB9752727.1 alpha/beta hydrolase [Oceanospirillaceae bacterium]MDC1340340.1 alpha/beta hydrolase [Oceanospirillaceae bacterium]|tara:strand:- start:2165 stop:3109 length:945 start_codon:yes stop_codon:yes gene_type:complete